MLFDRGVNIDRGWDEINLSQPETVASVHLEYLRAGAEIIETNTFGANAFGWNSPGCTTGSGR